MLILRTWYRAPLVCINNCPTRCNTKQSTHYSASSPYMFRVSNTPIIRRTQNCNYSLRYLTYFLCSYLPPTWPTLPCWREVASQRETALFWFPWSHIEFRVPGVTPGSLSHPDPRYRETPPGDSGNPEFRVNP